MATREQMRLLRDVMIQNQVYLERLKANEVRKLDPALRALLRLAGARRAVALRQQRADLLVDAGDGAVRRTVEPLPQERQAHGGKGQHTAHDQEPHVDQLHCSTPRVTLLKEPAMRGVMRTSMPPGILTYNRPPGLNVLVLAYTCTTCAHSVQ